MSFIHIIPEFINQVEPPVIPMSLIKTEPQAVIKNEPPESEIMENGIDDVLYSSDKEIIPDLKDIDIVYHTCEDSIKSENKHSEFVETQVLVKAENSLFIKTENITGRNKAEVTSDETITRGTGQGVVEVLDSNEYSNALSVNFSKDLNSVSISRKSKSSKKTDFDECCKTVETISWKKEKEKIKVIEAPVIPVEPHEYTSLAKDKHICNHCQDAFKALSSLKVHIKQMHRKVTTIYQCPYCPFKSKWRSTLRMHIIQKHKDTKDIQWFQCHLCEKKFKLKKHLTGHMVVHLTHKEIQNRLELCPICEKGFKRKSCMRRHIRFVHNIIQRKCQECEYTTTKSQLLEDHIENTHKKQRYPCDLCDSSYKEANLKKYKLNHLKPEEIQYFHCYHCSFKSKYKTSLKFHISTHFRKGDVPFHCHICDFTTSKRVAIIEHFKKHPEYHSKCDKTNYKYQLKTRTIEREKRYPEKRQPFLEIFARLIANLVEHGSFVRQRPKTYNKENREIKEINVLGYIEATPSSSCRKIEKEIGVPKTDAQKIMKKYKYYPYKFNIVQHLHPGDAERAPVTILSVVFAAGIERAQQGRFGVGVSCFILGRQIVYRIFEGGLTAHRYLEILEEVIPELLENMVPQVITLGS